jgi:hypothetical protein
VKKISEFVMSRLLAGVLVVAPIYLAALLLLKAMKSLAGLVEPFAHLLPKWLPADQVLSLLLVLAICFLIGLAIRNADRSSDLGTNGELLISENPWLCTFSEPHATAGRAGVRHSMEACASRDRGGSRPGFHH